MTDHTFFSFPPRLVFYILFRINSSSEESFPSLYAWKSTFSSSQSYFFTSQPIIRSLPAAHHGEVCEDLSSVGSYRSPCFVYNFFRNVYFFFMGSDPNECSAELRNAQPSGVDSGKIWWTENPRRISPVVCSKYWSSPSSLSIIICRMERHSGDALNSAILLSRLNLL